MGIEQIQLAKTKALLPAFQFNWSQMESSRAGIYDSPNRTRENRQTGDGADGSWRSKEENSTPRPRYQRRNLELRPRFNNRSRGAPRVAMKTKGPVSDYTDSRKYQLLSGTAALLCSQDFGCPHMTSKLCHFKWGLTEIVS